jgi:hypothetical protein
MSKKSDKVIIERESWETPGSPDYLAAKLTIVNAQVALRPGRKKGQLGDAPDPYVEIEYAGRIWETALVRATQQPKWNETFEVPIPPERRNQLGEIGIRVWDRNNSKKKGTKGQIFLGEVRLSLGDFGGVNFEYVEPRRYRLRARSPTSKDDSVDGNITFKIGMVLPKKRAFQDLHPTGPNGERSTQSLIAESESIADDSYESVMRSLALAENTRQIGADTLESLGKQGDQLRRIQEEMDDIEELQDRADRSMRTITSVGGALANKFAPKKSRRDHVTKGDKMRDKQKPGRETALEEEEEEEEERIRQHKRSGQHFRGKHNDRGDRSSNLYKEDFSHLGQDSQQKIKETDKGLDRISDLLDDMKLIALDMGDEINDHNRRLEILNRDIDTANVRMKQTNRKIKDRL